MVRGMSDRILVVGAGIAGITVSLGLAQAGHEVFLLEQDKVMGGKGRLYACKATERCQECSACLIAKSIAKLAHYPNIHPLTYSMLTGLQGNPPHLRASIRLLNEIRSDLGAETSLEVQAFVAATGFQIHHPEIPEEWGYPALKQVVLASELEPVLAEPQKFNARFGRLRRIGLALCIGSRDERPHHANYCSRYCCAYAQHLARRLSHLYPHVKIDVFYRDLFNIRSEDMVSNKVKLIRATPSKVFSYPAKPLTLSFADSYTGSLMEETYDLLILVPAQKPNNHLALDFPQLGLGQDARGFYLDNGQNKYQVPGVFAAGSCTGPKDIPETIAHAKGVVAQVLYYLAKSVHK